MNLRPLITFHDVENQLLPSLLTEKLKKYFLNVNKGGIWKFEFFSKFRIVLHEQTTSELKPIQVNFPPYYTLYNQKKCFISVNLEFFSMHKQLASSNQYESFHFIHESS